MNTSRMEFIPLDQIDFGDRLREVDNDYAQFLAGSMEQSGLIHPIEVRPVGARFELVAGGHRLTAAGLLGWATITAKISDLTDLEAELVQIDENLVQRVLSPFDKATFLTRRQELYTQLYPEAEGRKASGNIRWGNTTNKLFVASAEGTSASGQAPARLSFAADVAKKLGISEQDIRRHILRYRRLAGDVREKIVGTWIADNGVALDALSKCGESEQRKALDHLLHPETPVKSVTEALRRVRGSREEIQDPDGDRLIRLKMTWRGARPAVRRAFLDWLDLAGDVGAWKAGKAASQAAREGV